MNKIAIIIPSRLDAQRLPKKPLKLINSKEMILHVYEAALRSKAGEVYIASPDKEIIDLILTDKVHDYKIGTARFIDKINEFKTLVMNVYLINLKVKVAYYLNKMGLY